MKQKKAESYFVSVSQTLSVTYFIEPWLQYLERPSFSSASASFLYYSFEVHSIHKKSREVFKGSVSNDLLEYYHVRRGVSGWGGGGGGLMHLVKILLESLCFSFF